MNYCTVDDIKTKGRLDIESGDFDVDLDSMIAGLSRRIDRHYGVVDNAFCQTATATRYYEDDAVDWRTLVLDMPIITVSSIVNGDGVTVPADDYRLFPRNGRWYNEIRLRENATAISAWGFITDGEIAVTGKWGFTLAVPDEIREATTYWAAWLLKRYHAALQDASANFDLGQVVYSEGIPKPVINMLPGYRMMVG